MRTKRDTGMGRVTSWPHATGTMADAIRKHPWSETPLGAIESWPPVLRFALSGILESRFPSLLVWGRERIGLYNDACIPIFGERPSPLGQAFEITWADIWDEIRDVYEGAFAGTAGYREDLPLHVARPGVPDLSWWTFSCTPIRDEAGRICGVRAVILETTARVRLELRQSLLIRIGDVLRQQKCPGEIATNVCSELGQHFQADRVSYAEIDVGKGIARLGPGWATDQRAYRAEDIDLLAFGADYLPDLKSGVPSIVEDVANDPRAAGNTVYERLGIGSVMVIPLMRDGVWVNCLAVAMARPHAWTKDELSLAINVAERTWQALERMRAETSLRASNRRLEEALEAARMVAWDWDVEADRIDVTGSIVDVFGLKPGARIDTKSAGFLHVHPDDHERHSKIVEEAVAAQKGYESEFRVIRDCDGDIAWLEERALPKRDPASGKIGLTGLVWDVTRRKRAEIATEDARREVTDELTVLTRLHDWAVRVASPAEWQSLLDEMLAATMALLNADFGSIRLYDPADQTLAIISARNLESEYIKRFLVVSTSDESAAWGRSLKSGQRIVYDDLQNDLTDPALSNAARRHDCNALQITPLFDRNGAPVGALATAFRQSHVPSNREWRLIDLYGAQIADVISAKRARDALAASEQRQRGLIESMPLLVWRSTYDGQASWHSSQYYAYTGHKPEDSLDHGWLDAIHPDDRSKVREAWSKAGEHNLYICECRIWSAREGRYRWFQERAVAEPIGKGGSVEWIGTSTDIDELRTLHEQQRVLLTELQNRVRQTLSRLRTIVRRTAVSRDYFDEYVLRLDSRLGALARAQGPALRDPSAGVELSELVANELTAHQAREGERVTVAGPTLRLRLEAADTLALALHELAINAVEHGALARERGRVHVSWRIEDGANGRHLHLEWKETRCALPAPAEPVREGFGFQLLKRTLADEFKARTSITFATSGLICAIELPLTKRVVLT
ncbi:PAS domain-containing protein [Methylobacterium sp. C25]|uniref:PAS domain-containing protein n=1 Tax=Methylobacterium sp. C25 TaxID=2721622 RepID=UPI001F4697F2|nr:PAS domain-containing protein [Methylobacterium sp. C25]MCE4224356.1 PAS domain-containing protein [Methylobacterium sp. C25]